LATVGLVRLEEFHLTCTSVSFAHGTNDSQKSIGLIMLTTIGLFSTLFALNPVAGRSMTEVPKRAQAATVIQKYGDDKKFRALDAAKRLASSFCFDRNHLA
jgi:PiT family inorganic phosphate transporter